MEYSLPSKTSTGTITIKVLEPENRKLNKSIFWNCSALADYG